MSCAIQTRSWGGGGGGGGGESQQIGGLVGCSQQKSCMEWSRKLGGAL